MGPEIQSLKLKESTEVDFLKNWVYQWILYGVIVVIGIEDGGIE